MSKFSIDTREWGATRRIGKRTVEKADLLGGPRCPGVCALHCIRIEVMSDRGP